jgi:lipopolysaccharide transport system ATP-binding protein
MSQTVISVEHLSKAYYLGQIGTGTLSRDLQVWWAKQRGKPNPLLKIGDADHGNRDGEELWALRDVSFTVEQGEVLGIIGRNGAGKSTLLKILSRVTAPTSGKVKVKGRIASLLEVGTGFHPELTGRENIYLNGAILGMTRREIDRKFDEIVDFAEVEKFIDTPVKRYSSGMYVRLAFAVAAHLDPEILVVDEVLAVGDAEFQKKCLGKMGDVAKEGRTVLFVSHNMAAVQSLCSKTQLISHGRLSLSGNTDQVIEKYLEDLSSIGRQSLMQRTDRKGNGRLVFKDITFEDNNGKQLQELISGKDTNIILSYETKGKVVNIKASIGFYSGMGQFLLMCNNEMAGQPFETLPSSGQIKCSLPKLPFSQGLYRVNLYCEVNGELADWVQEATSVAVTNGDFYGTGKNVPSTHSGFLAAQTWTYLPKG